MREAHKVEKEAVKNLLTMSQQTTHSKYTTIVLVGQNHTSNPK